MDGRAIATAALGDAGRGGPRGAEARVVVRPERGAALMVGEPERVARATP